MKNQNANAAMTLVAFTAAQTLIARAMTPREDECVRVGVELGAEQGDTDASWTAALKLAKSPEERKCLRAGFVTGFAPDAAKGSKEFKSAQNRFDYLAKQHAPQTSRKAKHNAKKGKGGRPEKTESGKAEKLSEKDVASRLVKALGYISKAQAKWVGQDDVLEVLGELAAILGGK